MTNKMTFLIDVVTAPFFFTLNFCQQFAIKKNALPQNAGVIRIFLYLDINRTPSD